MQLGRRARSASCDRWAMAEKFASWNRLVEDFIVDIACGLANAAGYDFGHLLTARRFMIGAFNAGRNRFLEDSFVKGRGLRWPCLRCGL